MVNEMSITIAVSSRALFELEEEHAVWVEKGLGEYLALQKYRENDILKKGSAYPFIEVLELINSHLKKIGSSQKFEVVMLSHNHASTGIRLINSIVYHDGESPVKYLGSFNVDLFLTCYGDEVKDALNKGFAAATMSNQEIDGPVKDELRIAFDLDAVLFCDDSERKYQQLRTDNPETAVDLYEAYEESLCDEPLREGPLKKFAEAIGKMQKEFLKRGEKCPIKTYIVTARGVRPGKRALKTLIGWDLVINETFLMSGLSKDVVLKVIKPHIFFDDGEKHITEAKAAGVPSGHVNVM